MTTAAGALTCAYIGLGANLGDPLQALRDALEALRGLPQTRIDAISSFYLSAPVDAGGEDYVNAAARVQTSLPPHELLAGLQAIPRDLYEAAEMDRASPWRTLTRITLPLLMPNLVVVLVLAAIRAVQVFDEVFVLTGGGPGSATTFIVQFIYQTGFAEQIHLYGLAAAASLALAAFLVLLTLVQLRLTRANELGKKGR